MTARNLILTLLALATSCASPEVKSAKSVEQRPSDQADAGEPVAYAPATPPVVATSGPKPQPIAIIDSIAVEWDVRDASGYCEAHEKRVEVESAGEEADVGVSSVAKCIVMRDREAAAVVATRGVEGRWEFGLLLFGERAERVELEVPQGVHTPEDFDLREFAINPTRATLRYSLEGASKPGRIEAVCAIARAKRCEFFEISQ